MGSVDITSLVSGVIVVGFCLYLIALAVVIMVRPSLAERFLASFASSAEAHYTEQLGRLLVGVAMVNFARFMWFPDLFRLFGWLLIVTAAGLLLLPWQWHRELGRRAMPVVIRHRRWMALGASALGGFILYGASRAMMLWE